jgi:hypothetical protein
VGKLATTRSRRVNVEMTEFGKLRVIETRPNKSARRSSSVKRTKRKMQKWREGGNVDHEARQKE